MSEFCLPWQLKNRVMMNLFPGTAVILSGMNAKKQTVLPQTPMRNRETGDAQIP
jgi:hypothetical protein